MSDPVSSASAATVSIEQVIGRLRAWRDERGLPTYRLAEMAGLSHGAVRGIDDPAWSPNSTTLRKLEALIDKTEGAERKRGEAPDARQRRKAKTA